MNFRILVATCISTIVIVGFPQPNAIDSSEIITIPGTEHGTLDAGETVYFRFIADEGTRIYFAGITDTISYIVVLDSDGKTELANSGENELISPGRIRSQLGWTTTKSAEYFVGLTVNAFDGPNHSFEFHADDGSGDDHGDIPFLASAVVVGSASLLGQIDSTDDNDFFKFDVEPNTLYYIEVTTDQDALLTFPYTKFVRDGMYDWSLESNITLPAGERTHIPLMETTALTYSFKITSAALAHYSVNVITENVVFREYEFDPTVEEGSRVASTGIIEHDSDRHGFLILDAGRRYRIQTFGGAPTAIFITVANGFETIADSFESLPVFDENGIVEFIAPATGLFSIYVVPSRNFDETESDFIVLFEAEIPRLLPEDLDGNGSIDAVDVQIVINAALGIDDRPNVDVNINGDVDAVDVQLVINGALGLKNLEYTTAGYLRIQ
jgi:hypothetical protein